MSITLLLPMASKNIHINEQNNIYPAPLIEVQDKPIIQHVVENLSTIKGDIKFVFILDEQDCNKFHLDNSLRLLSPNVQNVIILKTPTQGSACSCLMAIDSINLEDELIISNSDQIFDCNINNFLDYFYSEKADAGVITFDSIHPRWSYARIEGSNLVTQAAEKNPISRHALAGFYYFKKARDFFTSSMKMIEKGSSVNDLYYIAPSLNEMILMGKRVIAYSIDKDQYHTFYSMQKIRDFERKKHEAS